MHRGLGPTPLAPKAWPASFRRAVVEVARWVASSRTVQEYEDHLADAVESLHAWMGQEYERAFDVQDPFWRAFDAGQLDLPGVVAQVARRMAVPEYHHDPGAEAEHGWAARPRAHGGPRGWP